MRLGLIRSFTRLSFNVFGEAGSQKDRLTGRKETAYEALSSMYLRLTRSQTYGAFLRYAHGENAETGRDRVAEQPQCREVSGIADTLVELTGQGATMRTLTDSQGRFLFTDVRPGAWTVNIGTDALPPYHSPEKNHFAIHVGPGETQEISVKVQPRVRSIMIIEQGETIIQEQKH